MSPAPGIPESEFKKRALAAHNGTVMCECCGRRPAVTIYATEWMCQKCADELRAAEKDG